MMGITQSKEYAEPERYADLSLVIVWVTYLVVLLAYAGAAQGTAYLRRQLVLPGVHPGRGDAAHRQILVPVSFGSASATRSPPACRMRMTQWCVRPQCRRLIPDGGFLGMMYYFLPNGPGGRCSSYRLSIISFWGITFLYMWAGSHPPALHGAAAVGADAGHDIFGDPARAVVVRSRQCAADAERRVAPSARRCHPALH